MLADCGAVARDRAENEANARLIAAAPDLLAACEAAHEALLRLELLVAPHEQRALDLVRAALHAAKGAA